MRKFRTTVMIAFLCLAAILTACGGAGNEKTEKAGDGVTKDLVAAETEDTDRDSDGESPDGGEQEPSKDLVVNGTDIYTQFIHLKVPGEWTDSVIYHYFQDPDRGRYALDIVEFNTMSSTEGEGGLVYSVVIYEGYGEEEGMDPSRRFLGMLKNEEGKYLYVFLEFPAKSLYTESSEEAYREILNYEDKIPVNLEGAGTYTFTAGENPAEGGTGEEKTKE